MIYSYYKFVQGLFTFHCVVNIFKILGGAWPPLAPCRSATAQQIDVQYVHVRLSPDQDVDRGFSRRFIIYVMTLVAAFFVSYSDH